MNNRPIGVFDSGVGGLSCVPAIKKLLPGEQIIYYGDTNRAPYGSRTAEEITEFSLDVAGKLVDLGCKSLSIACNTISCTAVGAIKNEYPDIPVIGIIEPAAETILKNCKGKRVGLIATEATVRSGAHEKALRDLGGDMPFFAKATPDFVPYIEAGKTDTTEFDEVVKKNLASLVNDDKIEAIVLGCTHYPFIASNIARLYPQLIIIDPAMALAEKTAAVLSDNNMLSESRQGKDVYLASHESDVFKKFVSSIR